MNVVGVVITSIVWMLSVSKVISLESNIFFIPYNYNGNICDWTIQVVPVNYSLRSMPINITTTDYYGNILYSRSKNITYTEKFRIDMCSEDEWNPEIKVLKLESQKEIAVTSFGVQHNNLRVPETKWISNEYILLDFYTCLIGIENDTIVYVYQDENSSLEIVYTVYLEALETFCLESNRTGPALMNSSIPFIAYMYNLKTKKDRNMESSSMVILPSSSEMGELFHLVLPSSSMHLSVVITAKSRGTVEIITNNESREMSFTPFSSFHLHFNKTESVTLTASTPIQILCTIWNVDSTRDISENVFYLFPEDNYSNCYTLYVDNCKDSVCALVMAQSPSRVDLFNSDGHISVSNSHFKHVNGIYYVWEIRNLTNGLYLVRVNDEKETLILFEMDALNGRFYVANPINDSVCNAICAQNTSVERNSIKGANKTTTEATNQQDLPDVAEQLNTSLLEITKSMLMTSSIATTIHIAIQNSNIKGKENNFIEDTKFINKSAELVDHEKFGRNYTINATEGVHGREINASYSKKQNCSIQINCTVPTMNNTNSEYEEIRPPSYQSQSNSSIQVDVSAIVSGVGQGNYDYLYHEVPEDDTILQDYMIAVIVSLCVSIFGVIAVISTFFLLEFVSRRKQIRNTKIRPFVS